MLSFLDGGNAFPPTSTQSLRASVPSCEVPPFFRKEFSSPGLSSTAPADRPASPTDHQAPQDSCHSPADHVSDVINGTAGRDFHFDGPVCQWRRPDHAGFPEFRPVGCNPGDSPPTWSYLQPLTRPA